MEVSNSLCFPSFDVGVTKKCISFKRDLLIKAQNSAAYSKIFLKSSRSKRCISKTLDPVENISNKKNYYKKCSLNQVRNSSHIEENVSNIKIAECVFL